MIFMIVLLPSMVKKDNVKSVDVKGVKKRIANEVGKRIPQIAT